MKKTIFISVIMFILTINVAKSFDRHAILDSIIKNPEIIKNYLFKKYRDLDIVQNAIKEEINLFNKYFNNGYVVVKDEEFFKELPEQCRGSAITIINKAEDTTIALIFDHKDSLVRIQEPLKHNPKELAITYMILDKIIKEPDSLWAYSRITCEWEKKFTIQIIKRLKEEFHDGYYIVNNGWWRGPTREQEQAVNMINFKSKRTGKELMVDFRKENDKWYIFEISDRDCDNSQP